MPDVFVCDAGELGDGSVRIVRAGKTEIGVIRHDGRYFAYRNECPHQGGPACEGVRMPQVIGVVGADGSLLGQRFDDADMHIVCPWHGYEFHLADGTHVCDPRVRLKKYDVVERDGGVYVSV